MNDFDWNDRDWRAIWVWYDSDRTAKPVPTDARTEKSTATIEDLKRKVGVT